MKKEHNDIELTNMWIMTTFFFSVFFKFRPVLVWISISFFAPWNVHLLSQTNPYSDVDIETIHCQTCNFPWIKMRENDAPAVNWHLTEVQEVDQGEAVIMPSHKIQIVIVHWL